MCLNVVLFLFAVLLFISPSNVYAPTFEEEKPVMPQEPPALPQPEQQSANWLVLTWPPGYCLWHKCLSAKMRSMFIIHGLWPVDSYGNILKNYPGNGNGIYQKQIQDIIALIPRNKQLAPEMDKYWPSLYRNSNLCFWLYEWNKHGTQQRSLDLPHYFNLTKEKAKSIFLLNKFSLGGIRPGRAYPHEQYMAVLKKMTNVHTGKPAVLLCNQRDSRNVLSEVVICLDKEAKNYVRCQEPPNYQGLRNNYVRCQEPPNYQGLRNNCVRCQEPPNYQGLCNQDKPILFLPVLDFN